MANEYENPKTDGDVLYDGDWNTTTNNILPGIIANLIWAGKNATSAPISDYHHNMVVDAIPESSSITTSTGFTFSDSAEYLFNDSTASFDYISSKGMLMKNNGVSQTITNAFVHVNYLVLTLNDDFNDSSVGGGWTAATTGSSTVTESTGKLNLNAISGAAGAHWTTDNYYQTKSKAYLEVTSGGSQFKLQVSDGSTVVDLDTETSSTNSSYVIDFLGSIDRCNVYKNGAFLTGKSLSTLTSNWYVKVEETNGGGSTTSNILYFGDDTNSSVSSTITIKASVDGGSNYETLTANNQSLTFSNTGNNPVLQFTGTKNASELLLLYGWGIAKTN